MTARRPLGTTLVTGAAGFLGRAVDARLRADGVAALATDVAAAAHVIPCDVTDAAAVDALFDGRRVDTVLHLGGVSGPMVSANDPLAILRINVLGTAHVLDAARRHGAGRVVVASSVDVYGATSGTVSEATAPRPVTVYGASKIAAEAAVMGYAAEHGLDALAIRLSWIYGPGRTTPTTLGRVLRAALAGEAVAVPAAASDLTHYLALADAVDGVLAAATAVDPAARVVNVTAGAGVPFGDVVAVVRSMHPALRVLYGTASPPVPAGFDGTLAAAQIGFRARVGLAEGLRGTLAVLAADDRSVAPP